jgi:hypothetical protein
MIGDLEKLVRRGDKIQMNVMGKNYTVEVIDIDVSEYERKYLVAFSDIPGDTKWITNPLIRQFQYMN